eukprot:Tbor_TRINITY_DN3416_c0_g1::TRINITY_DN3416_c0_g1_i1::g.3735::m.3735
MPRSNAKQHHSLTPSKKRGIPTFTRVTIAAITLCTGMFVMYIALGGFPNSLHEYSTTSHEPIANGNAKTPDTTSISVVGNHRVDDHVENKKKDNVVHIHFLTVQTSSNGGWCRMLFTFFLTQKIDYIRRRARDTGVTHGSNSQYHQFHNVGWGESYGHQKRPGWVLKWIEERQKKGFGNSNGGVLKDDDVLVFNDGEDTIYSGEGGGLEDGLLNSFISHTAPSKEALLRERGNGNSSYTLPAMLFNAEGNCYHQQTFSGVWAVRKGKCLSEYYRYHNKINQQLGKEAPFSSLANLQNHSLLSKYRYLNAGVWIARVWAAKEVLSLAKEKIRKNRKLWCDQSILGGILLYDGVHPLILGLDTQNRYFLPMYHVNLTTDFCHASGEGDGGTGLRMCHSGYTPLIIHFNGKNVRFIYDIIYRTSWWKYYGVNRRNLKNDTKKETPMSLVKEFLLGYGTFVGTREEKELSMRVICAGKVSFPEEDM